MMKTTEKESKSNAVFGVLIALALLRFLTMGLYPLTDSSEARYAEVARKMVELNDWITPWYEYGVPFWAKPPLSTWLTAASMKLFGINEFAARLPQFIMALAIARMVWNVAKEQSRRQAILAVAVLSGTLLYIVASAAVLTDMAMSLSTTMVMTAFWTLFRADQNAPADTARLVKTQWKLFIGLGLGMLAKGPVAIVLSTLPILMWLVLTGNAVLALKKIQWLKGGLIFTAISLPWYVAAETRTPGFIAYFFYGEHWQRFTVTGWAGDRYGSAHAEAHGYIWVLGIAAYLPWTLLVPLALIGRKTVGLKSLGVHQPNHQSAADTLAMAGPWQQLKRLWLARHARVDPTALSSMPPGYLLAWLLTPFLFFTMAGNVLWTYVLPGIPALALILSAWFDRDARHRKIDLLVMTALLVMTVIISGFLVKQQVNHSWKTAKFVVEQYRQRNSDALPLIFVGDKPYSGSFYSGGKVQHVEQFDDLTRKLAERPAFVALTPEQSLALPPDVSGKLTMLVRVDAYDLYRSAN